MQLFSTPLVAKCIVTIDVCIWHMFVFMSVVTVVGVCGNVCCVAAVVKIVFFSLGVLKYIVCLYCDAWSCRYGTCGVFRHAYVVCFVLYASCGSSQCCVLYDLQFVNVGRGCKR